MRNSAGRVELARLRAADPALVTLAGPAGAVLLSPGLQGRIFCALDERLVHRLDVDLLERPLPDEFNNLGGNSLWPAPEGGGFGFNYMPDRDEWVVQAGIATAVPQVIEATATHAVAEKEIELTNRRGVRLRLRWRRQVELLAAPAAAAGAECRGIAYRSVDELVPLEQYSAEDVLLAAWSLEQFPGGDAVVAFAALAGTPEAAINYDFYGRPEAPPRFRKHGFTIPLGGTAKYQLGIRLAAAPTVLGALDRDRGLLIWRTTPPRDDGVYFNIADNDQPDGPWSAADLFSVFNGGELGFYELETIGAMTRRDRVLGSSSMVSETVILSGPVPALQERVRSRFAIDLEQDGG